MLGTRPHLGRLLLPSDDDPSASGVVISHQFWKERLGGNPQAIGAPIQVNGVPFTVVGVADPRFRGTLDVGTAPDVFVPFGAQRSRGPRRASSGPTPITGGCWSSRAPRPGVAPETVRARAEAILRADVRAARPVLADASLPAHATRSGRVRAVVHARRAARARCACC